jgi:hypothetical protein
MELSTASSLRDELRRVFPPLTLARLAESELPAEALSMSPEGYMFSVHINFPA